MADTRIDELRRRLERDPGSRLFAQLAEEHRKAGDHPEAIRVARAGLAVHPAYPSARLTLGRALLDVGDAAAARVELAEVLREAPDNILASRFLGQALEMAGDVAGALKQYELTLKMAPGDRQLEAQIAAVRLRAQSGGRVTPEVTAPMRPVAPPLPPAAMAAPRPTGAPTAEPPPVTRPTPQTQARPPVPPPPTQRMVRPPGEGAPAVDRTGEGPTPSEATILIGPATGPVVSIPHAPTSEPGTGAAAPQSREARTMLDDRLAEAPVLMGRPSAPAPPEETSEEAPTRPKAVVPDLSSLVNTLPPAEKPPRTVVDSASADAPAPAEPTAATAQAPIDATPPPRSRPGDPADTLSPEEAAATSLSGGRAALSSSTLAELYLRQGLTERARQVYRQVLAEDPANERASAGLRDLEAAVALGGPVAERAARRAALQRTVEALEAMLAAVRRD